MNYHHATNLLTSHLTAHGLPVDPLIWIRGVDAVLSGIGDEKAIEAVNPLKPVPYLLSETSRIRGAWRVSHATGEIMAPIQALSSLPKVLRHAIGDGKRVVLVVTPDYAPGIIVNLSDDKTLRQDLASGLFYNRLARNGLFSKEDAGRLFRSWLASVKSSQGEEIKTVFSQDYPAALTAITENAGLIIKRTNESLIRGMAVCLGLNGAGELVGVLNSSAIVMVEPDQVEQAVKAWTTGLGSLGSCLVTFRAGWSLGEAVEHAPITGRWTPRCDSPLAPMISMSARATSAIEKLNSGALAGELAGNPEIVYGLSLAALRASDKFRLALSSADADVRRWAKEVERTAKGIANTRAAAVLAGEIILSVGDNDEAARVMLDWYKSNGHELLVMGDRLFGSTGDVWREITQSERYQNIRDALRGAVVEGEKSVSHVQLNQRWIDGVDKAIIDAVTVQAIRDHASTGARGLLSAPFDNPSPGVPLNDGLITEDGMIRPITADDRILADSVLDLGYDPNAKCPRWIRFLNEVWSDCSDVQERIAFLREWLGAALFGVATKRRGFPLLVGARRCGKSTLIEVVKSLFPDSTISAVTMDRLFGTEAQKSTHSLFGKRLNAVTEHPAIHIRDLAIFKQVVVGESVAAKSLYKDEYTFRPQAAWILAMNDLPTLTDTSGAALDRIVPLTFSRQFDEDDTLSKALAAERMGIILWAIEGLNSLKGRSYTTVPSALEARGEWHESSDSVAAYVAENMTDRGEDSHCEIVTVGLSALYESYANWCQGNGYRNPVNANGFGKRLKAINANWESKPTRIGGKTVRAYTVPHCNLRESSSF